MNINLLQQIMKSGNPQQAILNMLNPQQKAIAQTFLNNPNREQALQELMKQNNVSKEQVEKLTSVLTNNS